MRTATTPPRPFHCLAADDVPEARRPFVEDSPTHARIADFDSSAGGYSL